MEKRHDDEDDPFVNLNDIKEDTVQALGDNLADLEQKFGDNVSLNHCWLIY